MSTSEFDLLISQLEKLSVMPKEMPGIDKIRRALADTDWFQKIDAKKVIVIAGTNGKGSTCAILEALLTAAGQSVAFYSSPHLIDTTERIRVNRRQITKEHFMQLHQKNSERIAKFELTHFEALTLMAADYFFSESWGHQLDFAIFEVGLGGAFDATNAIPHATSVVTSLSLDHTAILGSNLQAIAKNKFGIVQKGNVVVHHPLPLEVRPLQKEIQLQTESIWYNSVAVLVETVPSHLMGAAPGYFLQTPWGRAEINLLGQRAGENAATALTVFETLGFSPKPYLHALNQIEWQGRMQRVRWPGLPAALYVSGDHNPDGVNSLLRLLTDFQWEKIHVIAGIGKDKDSSEMLEQLTSLKNCNLYLTETPFKGLALAEYPEKFKNLAKLLNADSASILNQLVQTVSEKDLVLVTGSLYLVGDVLKKIATNK